jgi:hypothetical protein
MAIWNRDHITPRAGQQAASPGESGFGLYAVTDHIGRPVMSVLWFNGSLQWEASYRPRLCKNGHCAMILPCIGGRV